MSKNKTIVRSALLALALAWASLACRSPQQHAAPTKAAWSYEGRGGPAHWGDLSPEYALAKTGKRQSPIDIVVAKTSPEDLAPLRVSYQDTTLDILNNGHTIEEDYQASHGTLTVDGHDYGLAQFHFHSPSEHTLDGHHAPLEMHLVHKDASGKLAVIGVMFAEGMAHPELAKLWQHLPATPGRAKAVEGVQVNATKLLPDSLASYRYSGSLTTPPCSEDVAWFVLRTPVQASGEQIAAFRKVIHGNNRPTQPLNGRVVTSSR